MSRNQILATFTAYTVCLALVPNLAQAQVKPIKLSGRGIADFIPLSPAEGPAFHFADGNSTLLGKYHAEGHARLDAFIGPLTAEFSSDGPVIFTAANGDELHIRYAGEVNLIPVDLSFTTFYSVWVADFTPIAGSTGRFQKVIGGKFTVTAVTDDFTFADRTNVPYVWEGSGSLMFGK